MGLPCAGSWVTYGLGSESRDLPAFVVMSDPLDRGLPKGNASNWSAGFLPGVYQGTWLKPKGDPIDNLLPPKDQNAAAQRGQLDLLAQLNRAHLEARPQDTDLAARIESYELAYRMQSAAPEALDLSREQRRPASSTGSTRSTAPTSRPSASPPGASSSAGALRPDLLRRHGEPAQLGRPRRHPGQPLAIRPRDRPARRRPPRRPRAPRPPRRHPRVWCGEFGRLPVAQKGKAPGRDHNPHCFTAGRRRGVKGGVSHGESDELGHKAAVDRVNVHDLHATILHLFGTRPRASHLHLQRAALPAHRRRRERDPPHPRVTGLKFGSRTCVLAGRAAIRHDPGTSAGSSPPLLSALVHPPSPRPIPLPERAAPRGSGPPRPRTRLRPGNAASTSNPPASRASSNSTFRRITIPRRLGFRDSSSSTEAPGAAGASRNSAVPAAYFASRGLVCATAEYRMLTKEETQALPAGRNEKARLCHRREERDPLVQAACRRTRDRSGEDHHRRRLGGWSHQRPRDPQSGLNDPADPSDMDTQVVAYLWFNPAFAPDDTADPEIDVLRFVKKDLPPAIAFFGTNDPWKKGWDTALAKWREAGCTSIDLRIAEGAQHGFFNQDPWQSVTLIAADRFLAGLGIAEGRTDPDRADDGRGVEKKNNGHLATTAKPAPRAASRPPPDDGGRASGSVPFRAGRPGPAGKG